MTVYVAKGHETISAGFTGETKRVGLVYDFAKDGGAYSGNSWTLGTISGKVLIEKVIVRATTAVVGNSSTVIIGHSDNDDYWVDATGGAEANLAVDLVAPNATTGIPLVLQDGKLITMKIGTANLTAGVIVVDVYYKDHRVG